MSFFSNTTPENQAAYGGQANPLQHTIDQVRARSGNQAARDVADNQNGGGKR